MADLEERLRQSLHRHADDAPAAHDLAPSARARLRSRRTARAVVAAVAVLAVAVPVGVQALAGHGPDAVPPVTAPKVHRPPADGFSPAPAGWRWETGNGLQALVPDTWGYGVDLTGTCNRQVEPGVPGAVEVPGTHLVNRCMPVRPPGGYLRFLAFSDLTPGEAARTTVGRWTTVLEHLGTGVVTVRDDDPVELRRILRSVSVVHGVDHNGCPLSPPRPSTVPGTDGEHPDVVSVCRYAVVDRHPGRRLSFSTTLTAARAAVVQESLRSATPSTQRAACLDVKEPTVIAFMRERFPRGWQTVRIRIAACLPGTYDGATVRVLTRPVARAALIGYREPAPAALGHLAGNWLRDNHR